MKISRNDSTLAHALAKSEAGILMQRDLERLRAWRHTGRRTMKAAFRDIRTMFGGRVIGEIIVREKGSRAEGYLLFLVPHSSGNLFLLTTQWRRQRIKSNTTPIVINHHALARMMQRTVGESDFSACIERLGPYVVQAFTESLNPESPRTEGSQLTVAGFGGALVFCWEDGDLTAKTWMDADMMADPVLRAAALQLNYSSTWVST